MNMDDKFELTLEIAQLILVVPIKVSNRRINKYGIVFCFIIS